MKSKAQDTVERARTLPAKRREEASRVWAIAYGDILDRVPKGSRLKSYEVHHVVTKCREAFLTELVAGKTLAECRVAALALAKF